MKTLAIDVLHHATATTANKFKKKKYHNKNLHFHLQLYDDYSFMLFLESEILY